MPTWWSPLGGTLQRLLGRGAGQDGAPPEGSAAPAPAPPARSPQAWLWQPPVQRALDAGWQPALRPDDFAAGLSSHQDPSLRRDLVHDVRPGAGGVVDGLADLAPGLPMARAGTVPLTVRPLPSGPSVQRSLAAFLPTAEAEAVEPATVRLEPPWAAKPEVRADAVEADEPVVSAPVEVASEPGSRVEVHPAATSPTAPTAPVGTRDVRVQRHAADDPVAPAAHAHAPDLPVAPTPLSASPDDEAARPVVAATVSRPALDAAPQIQRTADVAVRTLPVTAMPAPPRPVVAMPTVVRTLPVLQRREVTAASVDAPGTERSADPAGDLVVPPAPGAADVTRPTPPLSSFADAVQRLAVPAEADDLPEPVESPAPVGPVVPSSSAAGSRDWDSSPTTPSSWSQPSAPSGAESLESVPTEPLASPTPGDPGEEVDVEHAPLLGSGPELAADARPPVSSAAVDSVQRSELADLPVVPVAPEPDLRPGHGGAGDVPRLWPVEAAPALANAHPGVTVSPIERPLVVARTAAATVTPSPAPSAPSAPSAPTTVPSGPSPRPAEPTAPRPTVPLTGTRPLRVQRLDAGPMSPEVSPPPAAQPLRFGETGPLPSGTAGAAPAGPRTDPPAVQRGVDTLPAVAPGLVGPAPAEGGPSSVPRFDGFEDQVFQRVASAVPTAMGSVGLERADPSALPPTSYVQPVQRVAALPTPRPAAPPTAAAASAAPVRALPFDQMFSAPESGLPADETESGWTTVDLPVLAGPDRAVQRAVDTNAMTVEPAPATPPPAPEPAPAPAPAAAPPPPPAAATPGGGADLDEMARRLFDPLSARLRAELWLDRERAGLVADARF